VGDIPEDHQHEAGRIFPGLLGKGIPGDRLVPLGRGAHEEIRLQIELLRRLGLQELFELLAFGRPPANHGVAADEKGAHTGELQLGQPRLQVLHADPGAADVHGPEENEVGAHAGRLGGETRKCHLP
jgi:hypothetical protein